LSVEDWALTPSVVFTGLFSGLYGMLIFIFHRVMVRHGRSRVRPIPRSLPARGTQSSWETVRSFYFNLNWIRATSTWTAFGLFLGALIDSL
jgi:hypothetical protein